MTLLLDASAVLALYFEEPGGDVVAAAVAGARLSAVNLTEVIEKVDKKSGTGALVLADLGGLGVIVLPFTARHADIAGILKAKLPKGLSLADRACLALAIDASLPILTADRKWGDIGLDGLEIRLIR